MVFSIDLLLIDLIFHLINHMLQILARHIIDPFFRWKQTLIFSWSRGLLWRRIPNIWQVVVNLRFRHNKTIFLMISSPLVSTYPWMLFEVLSFLHFLVSLQVFSLCNETVRVYRFFIMRFLDFWKVLVVQLVLRLRCLSLSMNLGSGSVLKL